jgi:hypothetical protein
MRDLEIASTPFTVLGVAKYMSLVRKGEENGGFLNRMNLSLQGMEMKRLAMDHATRI